MNKPQPKQEIVVRHMEAGYYHIMVASNDARDWLMKEAPEYGSLFINDNAGVTSVIEFGFSISPLYDAETVIPYLEKMGAG
jgi:hypothetical protein